MAWPFGRFRFVVLIGVAVFVLWKVSLSLGYFWFFPNSETLLGDLRDRYREFHFFSQGLDPKLQDPLLGYPAWSYLMAGIWAWPERFDQAKLLFLAIQSVALVVVGYDLMGRLRLGLPAMILVAVASAPVYVLLDLLGLGNYGIIEAAFFYFSMVGRLPAVRGLALVGSILKPQTGFAVWIAAIGRRDWRVVGVSGGLVLLLLAIASKVLGQSSVGDALIISIRRVITAFCPMLFRRDGSPLPVPLRSAICSWRSAWELFLRWCWIPWLATFLRQPYSPC